MSWFPRVARFSQPRAERRNPFRILWAVALLALVGCEQRETSTQTLLRSSIFSHVEVIGSRGTGAGQFNKPRSLALDTNDNLFVVDMTGRVQKFSSDGKFLLSWQMPETEIGKPKGMDRDRDGNIVILEPHYQRVNHFTPDGQLVAQWGVKGTNAGELTLPRAIAVDTKNNVIVSEYTLVDRVQKFSARGERCLATWGTQGLAPGQFNRAEGVGVDAHDRIYVADSCAHRIQIFSNDGKFLRAYGKAGDAKGELNYPYDVRVDEQGRQYVCEYGGSRLQVFDANDRPLEIIGKPGGEPGEFDKPWSIAFDSKGNLYVADSMNHRVQKLVRRQNPKSKSQIPNKFQNPKSKLQRMAARRALEPNRGGARIWNLKFGNLDFVWILGFGIWSLSPR
jgi:DNA-binding beta-propeller fold protein YncE